jgi:hypothetical protein
VEISTWIHMVLSHGADPNPRAGPTPLKEGVDSTRVSLFVFTFGSLCNVSHSWHSHPPAGSCICSRCATGSHLT